MSQAGIINVQGSGSGPIETLSGENGTHEPPSGGNFNFSGSTAGGSSSNGAILFSSTTAGEMNAAVQVDGVTVTINGSNQLVASPSSSYISLSPYIVGPDAHSGYATIAAAITAAAGAGASFSSPANIYIKPQSGGYTENPVLQDGINLIGFGQSPVINGKITYSGNGTSVIEGVTLQTNSDYALSLTGSVQVNLRIKDCYLNFSNNTGINYTTSGASLLEFYNCNGTLGLSSITYFTMSAAYPLRMYSCNLTGSSTVNSTNSSSSVTDVSIFDSFFGPGLTGSNSGIIAVYNSRIEGHGIVINGTSGKDIILNSSVSTGTSGVAAISIGAGASMILSNATITSTNTNVLTGSGTLNYAFLSFTANSGVNVTTTSPLATLI